MKSILIFIFCISSSILVHAQSFSEYDSLTSNVGAPKDLDLADLDNDGDLDILQASTKKANISWLENLGNGKYLDHVIEEAEIYSPENIVSGDIDNDGDLDIVVTSQKSPRLVLFENKGKNSFAYIPLDSRNEAYGLCLLDIDNDDLLDIAYGVNDENGSVYLLYNNGNFDFTVDTLLKDRGLELELFANDTDSDGIGELFTWSSRVGKIGVIDSIGLDFTDTILSEIITELVDLTFSDINGDGMLDLIPSANPVIYEDRPFTYFLNDGNGAFQAQVFPFLDPRGAYSTDFDNDGDNDIILVTRSNDFLFLNNNSNVSLSIDTINDIESEAILLKGGDMNGDGKDEFVAINGFDKITIYHQEVLSLRSKTIASFTDIFSPNGITKSDLNNDGKVEIIGYSAAEKSAVIFICDSGGVYTGFKFIELPPSTSFIYGFQDLSFQDINNDGLQDIIAGANIAAADMLIYINQGDFNFERVNINTLYNSTEALAGDDINNDGNIDIVASVNSGESIILATNTGNLDFSFSVITDDLTNVYEINLVDINGDNTLDIIAFYGDDEDRCAIIESSGNGNFAITQDGLYGKIIEDLDSDGDLDIIGYNNSEVVAYYNDGNSQFRQESLFFVSRPHENDFLYASDINDDDLLDIISLDEGTTSSVYYSLQNNDSTFSNPIRLNVDLGFVSVKQLLTTDFDFDGDEDLAMVATDSYYKFGLYENLIINCTVEGEDQIINSCGTYILEDGTSIDQSTTFTSTEYNTFGCDSIIYYDITIVNTDTTIVQMENTLEVLETSNATFQWINCDNDFSPIQGETNASFEADSTGNYAVILTKEGCVDTSACVFVQTTSTNDFGGKVNIKTFPNPAKDKLNIKGLPVGGTITIQDVNGKVITTYDINAAQMELPITAFQTGIYFMKVFTEGESKVLTFMKH